jgi:PKD repeat protein
MDLYFINGGANTGTSFSSAYSVLLKSGAAKWSEFPYDSNYLQWCLNSAAWRDALNYRPLSYGQIYNSNMDTLISNLKTQLTNGHILVIGTYVNSWVQGVIANDPSNSLDDTFVGQKIATYVSNTNLGGHAMTVVGYNDNIWCDLNGNGLVNSGEKGAFKIANSWGTGDWNSGYRWITYDSLRGTSSVASSSTWPAANRSASGIIWSGSVYTLTARSSYTPSLVAQVTLNSARRNQIQFSLGTGSTSASLPSSTWTSQALNYSGGSYAFDGTTTACDATFYFDFSDLASSSSGNTRWFSGTKDSSVLNAAVLKSNNLYRITSAGDVLVASAADVPLTADASQIYSWVDYSFNQVNQAPVAKIIAGTTSGNIPLTVNFDGSASSDSDGSIAAYSWSFGDGSTASGAVVSHTYTTAGNFTATLTVTDNAGAIGSNSVIITSVNTNVNQSPIAVISVSAAGTGSLNLRFDGSASNDPDGSISVYAWSFGDGSTGSGSIVDHSYTAGGKYSIVLTVTDNDGASGNSSLLVTVTDPNTINAPSGLTVTAAKSQAILKWQDNSNNETGFFIERGIKTKAGYSYSRIAAVSAGSTSYTDNTTTGTYYYRLQAYNSDTNVTSSWSNAVSVRVK